MDDATLTKYAELLVAFGANVQPGQIVRVRGFTGHERPARAVAEAAYKRGATFVDVTYFDPYVKRARLLHADEATLDVVPSWYGDALLAAHQQECAGIAFMGSQVAPGLYADIDPARAARDLLPLLKEGQQVMNERRMNTTLTCWPTEGWASLVHPELSADAALKRLTADLAYMLRLDEDDPVAAWQERFRRLEAVRERLNDLRLDALHLEGVGTDLIVGLLEGSRWRTAGGTTTAGIHHVFNLPTEEIFTTPDPDRIDGTVRATRPLSIVGGGLTPIHGLVAGFEGGRLLHLDADSGADVLRRRLKVDDGASRIGEIALVDGESRVGSLGTTFYDTLLDENATSHMAFGFGFDWALEGEEARSRRNRSRFHQDFMVGGPEVTVTGITRDGTRVPVLEGEGWRL